MVPEEIPLGRQRIGQGLVTLDILLRPVHDADETQLEWIYSSRKNVHSICPVIHEIQLCEHANRPPSHRVHMPGQLESFGIDEIDVGRGNSEDDAVGFRNVFRNQIPRLLFDVGRLVSDGHL
jgi:hypothetical protein